MAQNVVDFSGNPSGSGLMDDYLDKDQQNVLTSNSGIQRPSYAVAGTKWLDTSVTPWLWKMYDGTNDVTLGTVNPSTHLFTPAGVLPSQDGQSGKFLQTNGSNTVWTDAVDYTNITNCITAIPQDIKLELNDGILTLKAGSQPRDGQGNVINIANDIVVNGFPQATGTFMFFAQTNGLNFDYADVNICYSGTSKPSSGSYVFFDTSTKKVSLYMDNVYLRDESLPVAIVSASNGVITSIDQVFNGFGYIGNTVFVLPGVEGLIPNGRNTDGSLNNTKFKTNSVLTFTEFNTSGSENRFFLLTENAIYCPSTDRYTYNPSQNINVYNGTKGNDCIAGSVSLDSTGRITSFKPKTVFQAQDYYDVPKLATDNTFTGVNQFMGNNAKLLTIKNPEMDLVNGVSSEYVARLRVLDKNDKAVGDFYIGQNSFSSFTQLVAYNSSGKYSNIVAKITEDGTRSTIAPTPPTTDNSIQIATTNFVNNFMSHITSTAGGGYVYIGNLLIQWGTSGSGAQQRDITVTFPKPFANTNYGLATSLGAGHRDVTYSDFIRSVSNTGFVWHVINDFGFSKWIAIGQRG